MRWLYTCLYALLIPVIFLRLLWRSIKSPGYRQRWSERLGKVSFVPEGDGCIWVHAVSVGETLAAVPLIKAIQARWPEKLVVVTTMTPTGSTQVHRVFGDSVFHVYAPYDLPFLVSRFLDRVRPQLTIIMETELWPNLIHGCYVRHIPVLVANARLSDKSFRGYQRIARLSRSMLTEVGMIAAQTEADKRNFVQLGLPATQAIVTGNIKFDLTLEESTRQAAAFLRQEIGKNRPVWIVASTHNGEDSIVVDAHQQLLQKFSNLLLILVPRHPERFDEVAKLCEARGLKVVRRSSGKTPQPHHQLWLGDTLGELLMLLGIADVCFIGGSLVPVGGHNMIEAAAWGKPVLIGPHLFNFKEASDLLIEAGAMTVSESADQIAQSVDRLLSDDNARSKQGEKALAVANANRGALQRLFELVENQLESSTARSH